MTALPTAGLSLVYDSDMDAQLGLSRTQIIRLWELRILNDLAYVALLLFHELKHSKRWEDQIKPAGGEFPHHITLDARDYDYLTRRWQGVTPKNNDGDVKELTCEMISRAFLAMAAKDFALAQTQQLSLFLHEEAPL
jgi:hypothetical protein